MNKTDLENERDHLTRRAGSLIEEGMRDDDRFHSVADRIIAISKSLHPERFPEITQGNPPSRAYLHHSA